MAGHGQSGQKSVRFLTLRQCLEHSLRKQGRTQDVCSRRYIFQGVQLCPESTGIVSFFRIGYKFYNLRLMQIQLHDIPLGKPVTASNTILLSWSKLFQSRATFPHYWCVTKQDKRFRAQAKHCEQRNHPFGIISNYSALKRLPTAGHFDFKIAPKKNCNI